MSHDLLLPLSEVPGLEVTGLRVLVQTPDDDRWHVAMRFDAADFGRRPIPVWVVLIAAFEGVEPSRFIMGQSSVLDVRIDLADAATRDRVVRWVAERLDVTVDATAPRWEADIGGEGWWTSTSAFGDRGMVSFAPAEARLYNLRVVPSLAELDPKNDTRLPDGSRAVDARALLLVARHLGQGVRS